MHPSILEKRDQLVAACKRFHVARLDIFGSATREKDFDLARSDADFLVDFGPAAPADLHFDLKETLENIIGRPIDLVDRKAVEQSRNYIRRRHILSGVEPVYVA